MCDTVNILDYNQNNKLLVNDESNLTTIQEAVTLSCMRCMWAQLTNFCLKSPYPVRTPEVGFFMSRSLDWVISGAQEQLWSDGLPDTTQRP